MTPGYFTDATIMYCFIKKWKMDSKWCDVKDVDRIYIIFIFEQNSASQTFVLCLEHSCLQKKQKKKPLIWKKGI
jgi:hypothetical protein